VGMRWAGVRCAPWDSAGVVAQRQERLLPAPSADEQDPSAGLTRAQLIGTVCVSMIVVQLALRSWALLRSWFYFDDYRLLAQADQGTWSVGYLASPFDSQFMPWGRAVVKLVAEAGRADWTAAAIGTLGTQAAASFACLWMLVTLFGVRWGIVGLLGIYLTSALTMPALMWWAAALNQVPAQLVFFCAVSCWVRHARTGRRRWLLGTLLALTFGLMVYVKVVLFVPVLAFLAVAYFSEGGPRARVGTVVRRFWLAAVPLVVGTGAFAIYYASRVPSISSGSSWGLAADLARTMLGTTLPTGLLGGPWQWDNRNPPVALADPWPWTVALSWVVLAGVVVTTVAMRRGAGRGWLLLALYVAACYALLLRTRANVAGADIGLEPRYLTDVVPVAVLCLGLACMPLVGATEASNPRGRRRPSSTGLRATIAAGVVLVCAGGVASSTAYALIWHRDNPGEAWTRNAISGLAELEGAAPVTVADAVVPDPVVAAFNYPWNTLRRVLPVLARGVTFPDTAEDLVAFDRDGHPRRAVIDPVTASPRGPERDCGWRVRGPDGATIPLEGQAISYRWWIRVAYLASDNDTARVRAGDQSRDVTVRRGLHNLFVEVDAAFDEVRITGLLPGSSLCVDTVEVGRAVPGGPL